MFTDPIFLILIILLILVTSVQIYVYLFVYGKFNSHKISTYQSELYPVSIIISSRNEIKNLEQFLPEILNQDYPKFEVLIADDGSWDGTKAYLESLMPNYPYLKRIEIQVEDKYHRGKKFALTLAIKAAQYEHLLFTDADCKPLHQNWIRSIISHFNENTEIVLGYSRYKKESNLLNLFVRWETFYTALHYFSYAIKGMAYMGVGRNLAYKKSLFFKNKGFASHQHIPAGDDDLFVNENANAQNTNVIYDIESVTETIAPKTWKAWYNQKKRHIYTSKFYQSKHKFKLAIINLSHILFYMLFLTLLLFAPSFWYIPITLYLVRFIIQAIILNKSLKKLNSSHLWSLFPIFDILMVFYFIIIGLSGLFTRKLVWKK